MVRLWRLQGSRRSWLLSWLRLLRLLGSLLNKGTRLRRGNRLSRRSLRNRGPLLDLRCCLLNLCSGDLWLGFLLLCLKHGLLLLQPALLLLLIFQCHLLLLLLPDLLLLAELYLLGRDFFLFLFKLESLLGPGLFLILLDNIHHLRELLHLVLFITFELFFLLVF